MKDLTQGSIPRHLAGMAVFFVARLGKAAVAGVSSAGTATFLALAASQVIAAGALSLVSRAAGRKDQAGANLAFNQSVSLSLAAFAGTLVLGYGIGDRAIAALAADAETGALARSYLDWFLPSLACQFPIAAMGSALRGTGVVQPTMLVQTATVLLNVVLAPILIAGWGTGVPFGVPGAGLASSLSGIVGVAILVAIFPRVQHYLGVESRLLAPSRAVWGRIVAIGWPAAGEFFLMFVVLNVVFWVIRRFGPEAQAGFGIGMRVMQSIFLPAMAIAFAAAPIAGQNFGAGRFDRVRSSFFYSALIGSVIMLALTILCQWNAALLIQPFTADPAVSTVAARYLEVLSWNYVATGIVFSCSGMFQALGNTRPALLSSSLRLLTFAVPAMVLAPRPEIQLVDIWHLSVMSVAVQAVTSYVLLRREFARKLGPVTAAPVAAE
jgi:putative MATE family efflux protein